MKLYPDLHSKEMHSTLINGGVGVLPTDTVYGLVCRAADEAAVKRLYALKSRHAKPGTIVAANTDQLVEFGFRRAYMKPVEFYWPNPISIIIPTGLRLEYLHLSKGALPLRVPKDAALLTLLAQTGPLLTSSANLPGQPIANTLAEAQAYFGDKVDFYVDGGDLSNRQSSTIIRVTDDVVEVMRQGAVTINDKGEIVK